MYLESRHRCPLQLLLGISTRGRGSPAIGEETLLLLGRKKSDAL